MTNNPVPSIQDFAFRRLAELVSIDLTGCGIQTIAPRAFHSLRRLQKLLLSSNKLRTLDSAPLLPLLNLQTLELHLNPWFCNCSLRNTFQLVRERNVPLSLSPICIGPKRLRQSSWSKISLTDLACAPISQLNVTERFLKLSAGQNLTLTCVYTGQPPPTIRWRHKDRQMTVGENVVIKTEIDGLQITSYLTIRAVTQQDRGRYECGAHNLDGGAFTQFNIEIIDLQLAFTILRLKVYIILSACACMVLLVTFLLVGYSWQRKKNKSSQKNGTQWAKLLQQTKPRTDYLLVSLEDDKTMGWDQDESIGAEKYTDSLITSTISSSYHSLPDVADFSSKGWMDEKDQMHEQVEDLELHQGRTQECSPRQPGARQHEGEDEKKTVTFANPEHSLKLFSPIREEIPDIVIASSKKSNTNQETISVEEYKLLLQSLAKMKEACDRLKKTNLRADLNKLNTTISHLENSGLSGDVGNVKKRYEKVSKIFLNDCSRQKPVDVSFLKGETAEQLIDLTSK